MAACTAYTSLIVSGATQAGIDGTYLPGAVDVNGYTVFYKDGNTAPTSPYIAWSPSGGDGGAPTWFIFGPAYGFMLQRYVQVPSVAIGDCPTLGTWSSTGPGGGGGGTPTVTAGGGASAPTFGLPADVVALITSRHGSVANFLRLRNQGQI